ncbi:MAG TPA: phosphatase PAP2 family protein [Gemmatimonadaceae bacterium]|nr:phosphatase PAP2 family protein [Gemmatimonadaceae bacterium]
MVEPGLSPERRAETRSRFDLSRDVLYTTLRAIGRHANNFYTALGIYLIGGATIAVAGTALFVELASHVRSGATQTFDDAVMRWMAVHRIEWIERSLLEITSLGTGLVVMVIVAISALFLVATQHRFSAFLLLVASGGGIVLNAILKSSFDRERPRLFEWLTEPSSSSFPSGHAMSSAIVYFTVAYLIARLERRRWMRALTITIALLLVLLISVSRLYLGVHYPSDVIAGVVIGLAWAGFCLAGLEAVRVFGLRFRPRVLEQEEDLSKLERATKGFEE